MRDKPTDWQGYLPDHIEWPQELTGVVRRGEYIYLHHNETWLLMLSTREGDLVQVQKGGRVQARLAVNRITGEVVHPTPGSPIGEWQADLMGYGEQYRQAKERLRNAPIRPEERQRIGNPKRGIPKEVQP